MTSPRIGLALGGGGARGLAHIPMLEAVDEAGIKPTVIVGCSMGSLVGAAYAAGISGKQLRAHAQRLLANQFEALKLIVGEKKMNPLDLLSFTGITGLHLSAERLVQIALPEGLPDNIEDLPIPFKIVATNYSKMSEHVFDKGPLIPAIAASIAIPGVISGSMIDDDLYVDGGVTNPVPFNHLVGHCDKTIAIDVTGRPRAINGKHPSNIATAVGSLLIMFHQIADLRRAAGPPDIYIEPDMTKIGPADFFKVTDIFAAAENAKQQLAAELSGFVK